MWDNVAKLFVADGTMEIGLQGVYVGAKSIRRGSREGQDAVLGRRFPAVGPKEVRHRVRVHTVGADQATPSVTSAAVPSTLRVYA
jgi:hypothetical protein